MILHGDCREQLRALPDNSIDSIVTDPPYDLTANKKGGSGAASVNLDSPYGRARITTGGGFMGQQWDATGVAFDPTVWTECLRVLKPGGHLLAFGGTRTYHRMTVAIEDAGFEIRDSIHWLYGSGFPKSLDVSKAIDKAAGAQREVIGTKEVSRTFDGSDMVGGTVRSGEVPITAPASPAAAAAAGWGTALKPAHEPIVLARKPLVGTVAANVMAYGTGALNIDGTRIAGGDTTTRHNSSSSSYMTGTIGAVQPVVESYTTGSAAGRWPANLILTHSPDCATECVAGCPVAALNTQSAHLHNTGNSQQVNRSTSAMFGATQAAPMPRTMNYGDAGGASRFFTTTEWDPDIDVPFLYVAKPSRRERNAGLDGMPEQPAPKMDDGPFVSETGRDSTQVRAANFHPTVKPVALMRHLVRLVTPPGGTVLDPFLGSGTTAVAATLEGFAWIGCELTDDYLPIIEARVAWAEQHQPEPDLTLFNDAQ